MAMNEKLNFRADSETVSLAKAVAKTEGATLSEVLRMMVQKGLVKAAPKDQAERVKLLKSEVVTRLVKSMYDDIPVTDVDAREQALEKAWAEVLELCDGNEQEATRLIMGAIGR
jgi:antitoxin component of RelBE/YafQ-DinJ toxin-antitoxin module